MIQTVQLAITDGSYLATVREALCHSCAWHVEPVDRPDASQSCVLVLDEQAFERLPLPLANPERVVLITREDTHQLMAQAWEAGIVSVVSADDPLDTVLLAIMAAALRVAKSHSAAASSEISPNIGSVAAPNAPFHRTFESKHPKFQ
ncbi:MAG: hypothetical protein ABSC23_20905 [Bryobacteraceae bacterium]|jgi:hypothetical protein